MNKARAIALIIGVAALVGSTYVYASWRQEGAAKTEWDLPQRPPAATSIKFWEQRVASNPNSISALTLLAEGYIRQGREQHDLNAFRKAELTLQQVLEINDSYKPAAELLASVRISLHDFYGALALAGPLADERNSISALAITGDAHLALGHLDEADAAYTRYAAERDNDPGALSRQAFLAELRGDLQMAIELMTQAADSAWQNGDYTENIAWYEFHLGEMNLETGHPDEAEKHFNTSLSVHNGFYLALAGLGDLAYSRNDLDAAISYYQQALASAPDPGLMETLGDLYTLQGDHQAAEEQYQAVEATIAAVEFEARAYDRELSIFYADHDRNLDLSLELAEKDLAFRQDRNSYDTLAWALHKNGRHTEAAEAAEVAIQMGPPDATIYYHAGMIQLALGNEEVAEQLLNEALQIYPLFDHLQAERAREALESLEGS